jgi:hypothetical protein
MAITGAAHTGTAAAVALSTLVNKTSVTQLDFVANPGNVGIFYIGSSAVTVAGVNAYVALEPGQNWSAFRSDLRAGFIKLDPTALYVIGATTDKLHIVAVD